VCAQVKVEYAKDAALLQLQPVGCFPSVAVCCQAPTSGVLPWLWRLKAATAQSQLSRPAAAALNKQPPQSKRVPMWDNDSKENVTKLELAGATG
jgi:hypothetical protein